MLFGLAQQQLGFTDLFAQRHSAAGSRLLGFEFVDLGLNAFVHEFFSGRIIGVEAVVSIDVNFTDLVLEDLLDVRNAFQEHAVAQKRVVQPTAIKIVDEHAGLQLFSFDFLDHKVSQRLRSRSRKFPDLDNL